jgi:hypothetical protein
MEANISHTKINSPFFDRKTFIRQLDIIKKASETAQKKIDYHSAHDDDIIRAIDVVEDFLREKHRLCYGGQAINAHLPSKYKFYDPEYSIPDYDFFTPDQVSDIKSLVRALRKAGFTEISAREGMHEGTVKIYVDFIPVADMTSIDPKLYRILSNREYRYDGISYLDANTLRMLMYLEMSRPRGEVERWGKVYERLSLFNEFVPVKQCVEIRNSFKGALTDEQTDILLNFVIENKRIFMGGDIVSFYQKSVDYGKKRAEWLFKNNKPIIFISPSFEEDAKALQAQLGNIRIKTMISKGADLIPSIKILQSEEKTVAIIIEQTACNSYYNIPVKGDRLLRVASMDTLITSYFSLGLLDTRYFDMGAMECLANKMVEISVQARRNPSQFPFPFISLKCAGYQTTLPSLIRAKVKRITQKKRELQGDEMLPLSSRTANSKSSKNSRAKSSRAKNSRAKSSRAKSSRAKSSRAKSSKGLFNL